MDPKSDSQNKLLDQKPIILKALVDKQSNRILFAESDGDFVDMLFSFLTMPMGTIIRNTRERPSAMGIGCMNNLYSSVENFDKRTFRIEEFKTMLLHPRNEAAALCNNLKLKILDDETLRYFLCALECNIKYRVLSHYMNDSCACGKPMNREFILSGNEMKCQDEGAGVFVEAVNYIVSDELEVMPMLAATIFSNISKLGVTGSSVIEEREFLLGVTEILDLLKLSLVSKTPLTKVLLKREIGAEQSSKESGSYIKHQKGEHDAEHGELFVKLYISKSKKMLCFAEANGFFVSLLFSFLTIPLGYIAKQMQGDCPDPKGCIKHIYRSVMHVAAQNYLKSNTHEDILLSPKIAPGFGCENQLVDVEEGAHQKYYYWYSYDYNQRCMMDKLSSDRTVFTQSAWCAEPYTLGVKDPKTLYNEATSSGGGSMKGLQMFTITDNLIVRPISAISILSILSEMKVDFNDLEVQVVRVGKDEAKSLLVASLISETALTDVFYVKSLILLQLLSTSPKNQKKNVENEHARIRACAHHFDLFVSHIRNCFFNSIY